jgi:hypothetical protein
MKKEDDTWSPECPSCSYVPYQVLENKQMLFEILQMPQNFLEESQAAR